VSAETVLALAGVLAGATVQSALGFGLAIVAAPVLAATAGPETAAPTVAVIGLVSTALPLAAERRPLAVLGPQAAGLVGWALPGMAAGAAALALAPADVLAVLVAGAVLAAVAAHAVRARRAAATARPPARWPATAGAGALSGALATTTGLNGPPLVLHLLGRATPAQRRDTLAAVFLASNVLALAAFAASGTLALAPDAWALAAATVAGWALGRAAFRFLHDHHDAASLAVLALGAAVALAAAVRALG
jgi:uncharacterized membrane protein YfcA